MYACCNAVHICKGARRSLVLVTSYERLRGCSLKWYKESQLQFQMGEGSLKELLLVKRKIYTHSYGKKLDKIYTGEIHTFAKCTRLNVATAPLGLLLVFYKIEIIEINSSMLQYIS